jgi:3-oxoacyl-[acyl-carrier-protein] synthase-3
MASNVGIYGIGIYLPEEIRGNDWWERSIVDSWTQKKQKLPSISKIVEAQGPQAGGLDPAAAAVLAAIGEYADDPFQGSVERRVAPESMNASEMEVRAARDAIERAGIRAGDIDFVLSHSALSDYHLCANACVVKEELGLPRKCLTLGVELACNTFAPQLELAESLIQSGRHRYGLLVQSSLGTRLVPKEQPASALFGDGATAVVVGPVADGYGVLGRSHYSDGNYFRGVVSGVPGKRWYDEGRVVMYVEDAGLARETFLFIGDRSKDAIVTALAEAKLTPEDVDFYACHQATAWIRKFTQTNAGMSKAKAIDTFPWTTSIFSGNVPLILGLAEREGRLVNGEIFATFAGGLGFTWSAIAGRWGRG